MLLAIREKLTGWVLILIVMLLAVPFALFGINNYFEARIDRFVAKVNDEEIDPQSLQDRLDLQRRQMRQRFGNDMPLDFLSTPENKRQVLDELIDEALRFQDAQRHGIEVPVSKVQAAILEVDAFKPDGRFDEATYQAVLRNNNLTPQRFEDLLVREMLANEIIRGIAASTVVSEAEVDAWLRISGQTRSFRSLVLASAEQELEQAPDEEAIARHYEANMADYRTPERIVIEYVEVSAEKLAINAPGEQQLREVYEAQANRYVVPEERLASHILIQVGGNADAEAQRAALARAEELLSAIRDGGDFAELAKASSDDLGSKDQGGDLGWLERGSTDQAFEDALFALQPGQVSEPVLGGDGYHLIQLREVRAEQRRDFEEVREELAREYDQEERARRYNDIAGRLVDEVNRDPLSLDGPAGKLGLEVLRSEPFDRAMGGSGIAGNRRVVDAAFSDMVLERGQTSDLVDLGRDHAVALRVVERFPAEDKPLELVRAEIEAKLRSEAQRAALRERVEALDQRMQAGASLEDLAAEMGKAPDMADAVVRTAANVDRSLLDEVFKLPRPGAEPLRRALRLDDERMALVELSAVVDGNPAAAETAAREAARSQLQSEWAQAEAAAYIRSLRARAQIRIAEDRIR